MNSKTEQPVLPWHREAAKAIHETPYDIEAIRLGDNGESATATIIARHDPHAETLQLLDGIENDANHGIPFYAYGDNEAACDMAHRLESILSLVRAHLAAHGGGK